MGNLYKKIMMLTMEIIEIKPKNITNSILIETVIKMFISKISNYCLKLKIMKLIMETTFKTNY